MPTALVALMGQDKKVRDGRIAFILARDIGEAFVARDVTLAAVRALLADALAERRSRHGNLRFRLLSKAMRYRLVNLNR